MEILLVMVQNSNAQLPILKWTIKSTTLHGRLVIEKLSGPNNDQVRSLFSLRKSFSKPKMGTIEQICSSSDSKAVKRHRVVGRAEREGKPPILEVINRSMRSALGKNRITNSQQIPDPGKEKPRSSRSLNVFPTLSFPMVWIVGSAIRSRRVLETGYSGAWLKEDLIRLELCLSGHPESDSICHLNSPLLVQMTDLKLKVHFGYIKNQFLNVLWKLHTNIQVWKIHKDTWTCLDGRSVAKINI